MTEKTASEEALIVAALARERLAETATSNVPRCMFCGSTKTTVNGWTQTSPKPKPMMYRVSCPNYRCRATGPLRATVEAAKSAYRKERGHE